MCGLPRHATAGRTQVPQPCCQTSQPNELFILCNLPGLRYFVTATKNGPVTQDVHSHMLVTAVAFCLLPAISTVAC
jgi:hypothetical protein